MIRGMPLYSNDVNRRAAYNNNIGRFLENGWYNYLNDLMNDYDAEIRRMKLMERRGYRFRQSRLDLIGRTLSDLDLLKFELSRDIATMDPLLDTPLSGVPAIEKWVLKKTERYISFLENDRIEALLDIDPNFDVSQMTPRMSVAELATHGVGLRRQRSRSRGR